MDSSPSTGSLAGTVHRLRPPAVTLGEGADPVARVTPTAGEPVGRLPAPPVAPPEPSTAQRYASIGRATVRGYCVLVLLAGLATAVVAGLRDPVGPPADPARVAVVLALAAGSLLLSLLSERRRRQLSPASTWDVHSTWLLASAVLVPVRIALLLSLVLLVHALAVRRASVPRAGLFWGGAVLGLLAARLVVGWDTPVLSALRVLGAAVALLVVQGGTVVVLNRMVQVPRSWRSAVGEPAGLLAEATCLGVGALLVVGVVLDPWHAVFAIPALVLVESSSHVPLLRRAAELDVKTGLHSTVHWQNQATDRLVQARNRSRAAAVVLLDVDRFKVVNDTVGHVAGDAVLAAVAQAAAGQLRGDDVIGRFGGDEIVALLLDANVEQAAVVGDRMRSAVAGLEVETRGVDGAPLRVDGLTVSVGVAATRTVGYVLDDLVLAADGALLRAKRTGRNRVCSD